MLHPAVQRDHHHVGLWSVSSDCPELHTTSSCSKLTPLKLTILASQGSCGHSAGRGKTSRLIIPTALMTSFFLSCLWLLSGLLPGAEGMLWKGFRGFSSRILPTSCQYGWLFWDRRHLDIKLFFNARLTFHYREQRFQRRGVCHRAYSSDWKVIGSHYILTTWLYPIPHGACFK